MYGIVILSLAQFIGSIRCCSGLSLLLATNRNISYMITPPSTATTNHPASDTVRLIGQSVEILTTREEIDLGIRRCEIAGRICYQSEGKAGTREDFIRRILNAQHESVIEHASLTVVFTTDRATSHQLVRHRLASFSQESQRYCRYSAGKFGGKLCIVPPQSFYNNETPYAWHAKFIQRMESCYEAYIDSLDKGFKPEDARCFLPEATKTTIAITANLREWRHILKLRCAKSAQPQARALMLAVHQALQPWKYITEDIQINTDGIYKMPEVPTIPTMAGILNL